MAGSRGWAPPPGRAMDRIRIIEYRGARIVHVSFAGMESTEELRAAVREAGEVLRGQPPRSALVLIDLEGVPFTLQNIALAGRALEENRPYVRARAICGLPAIAQLSFSALARLSRRPMEPFRDTATAMDWLVEMAR